MAKQQSKTNSNSNANSSSNRMAKRTSKVAPKPEPNDSESQLGTLLAMPMSDIDHESFDNQRTGDFTVASSSEDGSDQAFNELVTSIEEAGQKDPITVRRKAAGKVDNGKPYEVVKGFRRFYACKLIADKREVEDPTINVIVKELDDLEALEENLFENTARDDLSGADLAWGAYTLQESYKAAGLPSSDNVVSKRLGKNQPYISKLLKIVRNAPDVARLWRESLAPLKTDSLKEIAALPRAEQMQAYESAIAIASGQAPADSGSTIATKAERQAVRLAKTVGGLVGQSLVTSAIDWKTDLGLLIDIRPLTSTEILAIASKAETAFHEAAKPKPTEQPAPIQQVSTLQ